jgi:recombination protein RecA
MTDRGWREAGELAAGDHLARPRRTLGFGDHEPISPAHARMLGYLIGDGYVGGKTPIAFINTEDPLQEDAIAIAASLACKAHRDGIETSFSHRVGEKNGVLELARWAGIWGHLASTKRIAPAFFAPDVSAEVVANLIFGLLETDGWVSREQTGAIRVGFCTTSEQLAHQLHWLLSRWGIGSSVRVHDPGQTRPSLIKGRRVQGKLPCWQVRVSGMDNVARFVEAIPTWGPRGQVLLQELGDTTLRRHGTSQQVYLSGSMTEPVTEYLRGLGVSPRAAAQLIGDIAGDPVGGMKQVLGVARIRRDRLERLADALNSDFLNDVLDEDVWYDRIVAVSPPQCRPVYDIEVDEHHTFVADDVVVSNCASPFKTAEFDITYGRGISREGSLLDVGLDLGLVKKSGAWYTYQGEQLGQGRENAKQFLAENPEVMVEINERIRQEVAMGTKVDDVPLGEGEGDDEPIVLKD